MGAYPEDPQAMTHEDHETQEMDVMERIAHNTHKTADYQKKTEDKLDDLKCLIKKMNKKGGKHMSSSNVAEIIAARDRGDMGNDRNNDGLLGGTGLLTGVVLGRVLDGNNNGANSTAALATTLASDFNAAQQSAILGAIQNGTVASIAASNNNAQMQAQHASDVSTCNGFLQVSQSFGNLNSYLCSQFDDVNNTTVAESRATNANINAFERETAVGLCKVGSEISEVKFQGALNAKDTAMQIAEVKFQAELTAKDAALQLATCCCEIKEQAEANKNAILQQMAADKLEDVREDLREERRARDNERASTQILNLGTMVGNAIDSFKIKAA